MTGSVTFAPMSASSTASVPAFRSAPSPVSPSTRRRPVTTAVCTLALLVGVAACGGGGGSADDLAGVKSDLEEAGIVCDGTIEPYEREENEVDLGVVPTESFECTIDEVRVQGTGFASQADREKAIDVSTTLVCGVAGDQFSYVAAGPWMVTAQRDATNTSDQPMLERIAEATGADKSTIECKEEPGAIHGTGHTGTTVAPGGTGGAGDTDATDNTDHSGHDDAGHDGHTATTTP